MTNIGELWVYLNADASNYIASLQKARDEIKTFDSDMKAVSVTLSLMGAAGIAAISDMVESFDQEEKAIARLNQQLVNWGNYSEATSDAMIDQAKALQEITLYTDKEIISGQAMLASFRLNSDQVKTLTPLLLDISTMTNKVTGSQMGLEGAAKLVGLAFEGQVGRLRQAGISVTDLEKDIINMSTREEKAAMITHVLEINARGLAEAEGKTLTGALKQVSNEFDDLKQIMASGIVPVLTDIAKHMSNLIIYLKDVTPNVTEFAGKMLLLVTVFASVTAAIIATILIMAKFKTALTILNISLAGFGGGLGLVAIALISTAAALGVYMSNQEEAAESTGRLAEQTRILKEIEEAEEVQSSKVVKEAEKLDATYKLLERSAGESKSKIDELNNTYDLAKTKLDELNESYKALKSSLENVTPYAEASDELKTLKDEEIALKQQMNEAESEGNKPLYSADDFREAYEQRRISLETFNDALEDISAWDALETKMEANRLAQEKQKLIQDQTKSSFEDMINKIEKPAERLTIDEVKEKLIALKSQIGIAQTTFQDSELAVDVEKTNLSKIEKKMVDVQTKYLELVKAAKDNPIIVSLRQELANLNLSVSGLPENLRPPTPTGMPDISTITYPKPPEQSVSYPSDKPTKNVFVNIYGSDIDKYGISREITEAG